MTIEIVSFPKKKKKVIFQFAIWTRPEGDPNGALSAQVVSSYLWLCQQLAMENCHLYRFFPVKLMISHRYLSLAEGMSWENGTMINILWQSNTEGKSTKSTSTIEFDDSPESMSMNKDFRAMSDCRRSHTHRRNHNPMGNLHFFGIIWWCFLLKRWD